MNYEVISAQELDAGLIERWSEIQSSHAMLASPYFRPEFAQAVAAVRDDVRIGIIKEGGRVLGFFPFHRGWMGVARPLGLGLSDHHGVIIDPQVEWKAEELLRGCGLVRWEFDHLLAVQTPWQHFHQRLARSPIIRTDHGFATYEQHRLEMGGKQLKDTYRCMRKLEREHTLHQFTFHTLDPSAFEAAIEWKRRQCRETGVFDFFGLPWTVALLRKLLEQQSPEFAGVLSTVHVGERIASVHFGMRSRNVLHFWFPSYDDAYSGYSPGSILLVELIRNACQSEIEYIDLGKGMAPYKERFMTDALMVAEGYAARPALVNHLHDFRKRVQAYTRSSPLHSILRWPGRLIKWFDRGRRYG